MRSQIQNCLEADNLELRQKVRRLEAREGKLVDDIRKWLEYFRAVERGEYNRHVNTFELILRDRFAKTFKELGLTPPTDSEGADDE